MPKLFENRLFTSLKDAKNILIAGAGGGFDIYSGVPLGLALSDKNIVFVNFTFTFMSATDAEKVYPNCWKVSPDADEYLPSYFPEKYLSMWLEKHQQNIPIYALDRTGVQPLLKAYQFLVNQYDIDAVVLVDGGTDSLMFGDEPQLGTPVEDMTSIMAVNQLDVPTKILSCLGFGIDAFHGVEHYYFLENVAKLSRENAFLGTFSMLPQMDEAKLFTELIEYVNKKMPMSPSIVANSVNSALQGHYGDYHATFRTKRSEMYINPLMSMYWSFDLDTVANHLHLKNHLQYTHSMEDVHFVIDMYRKKIKPKKSKSMPL